MAEEIYKKREIDGFHSGLHTKLDEIQVEVKKTNGRVSNLEKWQFFIMGGLAIIGFILVPLVFVFVNKFL